MKFRSAPFVKLRTLVTASALAVAASTTTAAAEEAKKTFDIPAQPLGKALTNFSKQSDVIVVAPTALTTGKTSNAIKGDMSSEEALKALLGEAALKYKTSEDGSIVLTLASAQVTGEQRTEPFRMAQISQEDTVREVGARDGNEQDEPDVIVVTGTSIRGVYPGSSPLEVYSSADINALGTTSVDEFLARVPQNLSSLTSNAGTSIGRVDNSGEINAVDLRGLGAGSTLVLLNGRRLSPAGFGTTPDTSLIPLAALDRVEVLTDGASSIYGSDAVAGVMNFVLKDEFEGASTSARISSVTEGGYQSGGVDQLVGANWTGGSALASVGFRSSGPLDAEDRKFATADPQYLAPVDQRVNAFLTARQSLNSNADIFGDFLYSKRDIKSVAASFTTSTVNRVDSRQYYGNVGLNYAISDGLQLQTIATYSNFANDRETLFLPDQLVGTSDEFETIDLTAKLDGNLFTLPAGDLRFAVGVNFLDETSEVETLSTGESVVISRETTALFGEILVPIVSPESNAPFAKRIELSASGRYTDTSDFGDNFDPKIGLLWGVNDSLKLRGTFSTSFRAPRLRQTRSGGSQAFIIPVTFFGGLPDPFTTDNSTVYLYANGVTNPNLTPETAESYTVGIDFTPTSIPGLSINATYYGIDYVDRIQEPTTDIFFALGNPELFTSIISDDVTPDSVGALVADTFRVLDFSGLGIDTSDSVAIANVVTQIYDIRLRNVGSSTIRGLDVRADYTTETGFGGLSAGTSASFIFEYDEQITSESPVVERLNSVTNPVDLRLRGYLGLSNDGWSGRINLNYVDSYENAALPGNDRVDSWTTVDFVTSYSFGAGRNGILRDTRIGLNVRNLFDEAPPFVEASGGAIGVATSIGFDPANADPFGRLITFEITKDW